MQAGAPPTGRIEALQRLSTPRPPENFKVQGQVSECARSSIRLEVPSVTKKSARSFIVTTAHVR